MNWHCPNCKTLNSQDRLKCEMCDYEVSSQAVVAKDVSNKQISSIQVTAANPPDLINEYQILGVKPNSTREEIRQAYKDLSSVWNPSLFANNPTLQQKAREKARELDEAYERLIINFENNAVDKQPPRNNMQAAAPKKTAQAPPLNIQKQSFGEQASATDKSGTLTPQPLSAYQGVEAMQKPRPWVRYWARQLDIILLGLPTGFIAGLLFPELIHDNTKLILGIILLPFIILVETFVISIFGTTPGKSILKIKLRTVDGSLLSFIDALKREFYIYLSGFGLGLPGVSLVTLLMSYRQLSTKGQTVWDKHGGFTVLHERIGAGRVIIFSILIFICLCIIGLLNLAIPINSFKEAEFSNKPIKQTTGELSQKNTEKKKYDSVQEELDAMNNSLKENKVSTSQSNPLADNLNVPSGQSTPGPSPMQINQMEQAAKMAPKNAQAWINLGNALMDAQRFGEAVDPYEKALALEPKNVVVLVDQGTCYRGVRQFDKAAELYRKALKLDPNFPNGHRNLGIVLVFDLHDDEQGVKELQKYLELVPNAPDADSIGKKIQELIATRRAEK